MSQEINQQIEKYCDDCKGNHYVHKEGALVNCPNCTIDGKKDKPYYINKEVNNGISPKKKRLPN